HRPTGRMKADSLLAVNQEAAGAGLRRALHERAVFHQDDAGLGGAPRRLGVLGIGGQSLAVPLVGSETREIDEREPHVRGPGELRRSEVADDLSAAALDGTGHATRVGLEIGASLFPEYRHATRARPRGTLRSSPK